MKSVNLLLKNKQKGIGLLEIIIALLVSSIMLLAITNMYGKFAQASKQQTEQSTAQDQANFAFLTLNRAIRMSGAGICVKPIVKTKTYFHQSQVFDNFPPILTAGSFNKLSATTRYRSFASPSKAELGLGRKLQAVTDSDAIMLIYSDNNTRTIDAVISDGGSVLSPQEASPYHARRLSARRELSARKPDPVFYHDGPTVKKTWIMVSDCEHTGVYRYEDATFAGVPSNVLPPPNAEGFLYNFSGNGQKSLISRLYGKLFYVAEDDQGIKSLYMEDLLSPNPKAEPVAAFVQKMKVEYLNPTTRQWISTAQRTALNNWDQEWPIRVTLFMYAGNKKTDNQDDQIVFSRILDIRN